MTFTKWKFEMYNMSWQREVSLESSVLTCSPNGGPIAVMRDRTKLVKVQGSGKPVIAIYSSSGKLISTFVWNSGNVLQLGWSTSEELLCVQEDGMVLVYDMFSNYQRTFSMGKDVQETRVTAAQVFESAIGTGVAVLTMAHRIFIVNNYKEPKTRLLAEIPGMQLGPSAWALVCEERHTRVMLALGPEIYSLSEAESRATIQHVDLGDEGAGVVVKMAVSSTSQSVALLTDRGKLWLGTVDLRHNYRLLDVRNFNIKQIAWCGEQGVVLNCDTSLEVIPCREDNLQFTMDCTSHLIQEKDCLRVVSATTHEIIQRVPQVVVDIFRINSTSPGSYLLEASQQFQKKSHRANEYIHLVKPKLAMAVGQCVEAAGHEFNPSHQKMLIKAAQFGKSFLPEFNPDSYVRMCRLLRVLNAVRDPKIGIPITFAQLQLLSIPLLVDMLVRRRQYFLAIQAVNYLHIPDSSSHILTHWASYKVKQRRQDSDQIAREIADKLGRTVGVSYTGIAKEAINDGRIELAIKLLDYEPRATLQVPLLLSLNKVEVALVKSIESGNTDLVYTVLIHLHENMQLGNFEMKIRQFPLAQALYLKYCKEHSRERLRMIYMQEDDHFAQAACFIQDAYDPKSTTSREASLVAAAEKFKIAKNELHACLCDEQLKLLKYQRTLEEKFHRDFVNGSLQDTVVGLLSLGEVKLADKLRTEYKVPDRRYWWLRIESLAEQGKWTDLEIFSKSKKSPVGYEPFVDVCLKHNNQSEALKYMPKVREELREKYISKLGISILSQGSDLSILAWLIKDVLGAVFNPKPLELGHSTWFVNP
ncbi:vacuolar protein sorting-associated protein 16 homolog isoform X2 [Macrosteles quadrilineatus]|uniref:vacuolar protein sorting-associated protein 16 homolog isoform X2 n=1 Tax=Macrosteles quadrilineatus TaxID=74068 RepID=UPI0023E2A4D8|nr:vacuolar protein sorting-associated protein 16 homolog isoform X2 [Macrosteles quadrilineatus]